MRDNRQLKDLAGIGPKMIDDFAKLRIGSVDHLAKSNPQKMYDKLCRITGQRQDPCVLDVFRCATEQARDPRLPAEQRNWWYWSKVQKRGQAK